MSRKATGEGLMPYSRPLTRFSKHGAKQQTLRNIDTFLHHLYALQNNGHQRAALPHGQLHDCLRDLRASLRRGHLGAHGLLLALRD